MFHWKKEGRIFDPTAHSHPGWLAEFAQAPASLLFEDRVRIYFSCRPPRDAKGQYVSYSSFVDLDRSNLHRIVRVADQPILSLGARGTFDEFGTYPVSVIRHGEKVIAYYGGWTRCESVPFNVAIGLATSDDEGVTFQRAGNGPILPYTQDEPFVLSGPKIRVYNGRWYLFYIAGSKWIAQPQVAEPVYRIRAAVSDDGVNWVKMNRDLIQVKLEADECQASPDVSFDGKKYHMFFCYRRSLNYRGKEGGYRIGYASSTDLVHWVRDDDKAGIDVSEDGWDAEMVSYPHVAEIDGTTWMFYLGNQVGRLGFGLARLEGKLNG